MKYLYAVRNRTTGKLVKDLANPPHKFWEREADCRKAIASSSKKRFRYYPDIFELVKFELVEVGKESKKRGEKEE